MLPTAILAVPTPESDFYSSPSNADSESVFADAGLMFPCAFLDFPLLQSSPGELDSSCHLAACIQHGNKTLDTAFDQSGNAYMLQHQTPNFFLKSKPYGDHVLGDASGVSVHPYAKPESTAEYADQDEMAMMQWTF
jgi:hypothetical protein